MQNGRLWYLLLQMELSTSRKLKPWNLEK
uniref:Uncharacterized protein n=1 Tax=Oryza meridionalis TaxID=40149 RepID=A0A0E0DG91_9ORYZ